MSRKEIQCRSHMINDANAAINGKTSGSLRSMGVESERDTEANHGTRSEQQNRDGGLGKSQRVQFCSGSGCIIAARKQSKDRNGGHGMKARALEQRRDVGRDHQRKQTSTHLRVEDLAIGRRNCGRRRIGNE